MVTVTAGDSDARGHEHLVGDAPQDFTDKLVGAIVGVELPVERIEGKWKTNQNRAEPDKMGVIAGLLGKGDPDSAAMASLVRQHTRSSRRGLD